MRRQPFMAFPYLYSVRRLLNIFLCICFGVLSFKGYPQGNLVPNPNFELFSTCPDWGNEIYKATPWFQPNIWNGNTTNSSSSEYLNQCSSDLYSNVPNNFFGLETAKSGSGYAGIFLYTASVPNGAREYIEVKLDSVLDAGQKYCVSFYVSLADNSYYGIDAIGAYFSIDSLLNSGNQGPVILVTPQISASNIITVTSGWVRIEGEFIASGGERYLTIGNFVTGSQVGTQFVSNSGGQYFQGLSYYYIDDVSVIRGNCLIGYPDLDSEVYVSVYPSPFSNLTTLRLEGYNPENAQLIVYDVFGKEVKKITQINTNAVLVERNNLPAGIYFYSLSENNKQLTSGKLLVQD
jgi:hypothetical protein